MSLYPSTSPFAREVADKVGGFPADFSDGAHAHELQEKPANQLDVSGSAR
jgi:hypothetical protein